MLGQRAGVDADADRRAELLGGFAMTSATLSGPPMLPGLSRTQCAPASIDLSASVWLKWMSAMIGIGDSPTIVLSASTSCSRGTAHAHDVGAGLGDAADLVHRRVEVRGLGLRHRLHGDGRAATDGDAADVDLSLRGHRPSIVRTGGRCRCAKVYGTARAAAGPDRRPDRRAGPCAAPRGAVRADRRDAGDARPRRRLRHAGAARPGARAGRDGDRPRRAARRTRGRSCRRTRRERLPFEDGAFDLAYSSSVVEHVRARAARGVRGRGAARRARLVRADAGALVPDRAARAAAVRALAAAERAPALLAPRGCRVAGRTSRCWAARSCRGCSPARSTPSASGGSSSRGSLCVRSAERGRLEPGEVPEAVERRPHARDGVLAGSRRTGRRSVEYGSGSAKNVSRRWRPMCAARSAFAACFDMSPLKRTT